MLLAVSITAGAATSGPSYQCEAKFFTMNSNGQQRARSDFAAGRYDQLTVNERSIYFRENAGQNKDYRRMNFVRGENSPSGVVNEMYAVDNQAVMIPSTAHEFMERGRGFVMVAQAGDRASNIVSTYYCRPE
jgi:hypothetical protein